MEEVRRRYRAGEAGEEPIFGDIVVQVGFAIGGSR